MAQKTPRSLKLANVGEVAVKVLRRYPHLPYVSNVALTDIEVGEIEWRAGVRVMVTTPEVEGVARWASEFGTPVLFKENSSYVQMSTRTHVDGVIVEVWDTVQFSKAWELALALGLKTIADMAEVEPARLLSLTAVKGEVA